MFLTDFETEKVTIKSSNIFEFSFVFVSEPSDYAVGSPFLPRSRIKQLYKASYVPILQFLVTTKIDTDCGENRK